MALDPATAKELLQKLDDDREAYLTRLTKAHETLARTLAGNAPAVHRSSSESAPQLPPRNSAVTSPFDPETPHKGSIFTGDETLDTDDDESLFVQETLPPESFSEDDFRHHITNHCWDQHGQRILEPVLRNKDRLRTATLFQDDGILGDRKASQSTHATVYEVGADGSALLYRAEALERSQTIWQSLKSTNADSAKRRLAAGKIVVVREPSPLLFGAIHLTMDPHFNMDGIFRLLADQSPTRAYMRGCFGSDPTQQGSYLFCFKYYTIVGSEREPMPWQSSDKDLRSTETHIPITSCCSVVALSLSGKPSTVLRNRSRRAEATVGHVFDPFAPWRVLSVQFFPDWKSTVDTHDSNRHYVNGPEAFLVTLLSEYRDAQKRFFEITRRVTQMTTPPPDFMFNPETRDNLLFEDGQFTYSRRYFWATQTLSVMNDNIQAMINAYKETFTEDVWTGEHGYIWPGKKDQSPRFANWRKRMANLKKLFDVEIEKLENIYALNAQEIKDLKSLKDQLFSGTSVRESREALRQAEITVQQNRNIKLLTMVTIFFLPMTFVTSVFGMTNMPQDASFRDFAIVTTTVCIPTYVLIVILNSSVGQKLLTALSLRITYDRLLESPLEPPGRVRSEIGRVAKSDQKPSTDRRLSPLRAARGGVVSRPAHTGSRPTVPESKELSRTASEPFQQLDRVSTVKFDLDTFDTSTSSPRRRATAMDVTSTAPHSATQTNTDPGANKQPSRRGTHLLRHLSRKFTSWDEKTESPV